MCSSSVQQHFFSFCISKKISNIMNVNVDFRRIFESFCRNTHEIKPWFSTCVPRNTTVPKITYLVPLKCTKYYYFERLGSTRWALIIKRFSSVENHWNKGLTVNDVTRVLLFLRAIIVLFSRRSFCTVVTKPLNLSH